MGKRSIFDNKILIADDNFELRKLLCLFLKKEGYTKIETAADCRSAEACILDEQPDFIILDVNLPDGDGFSLMKRIRENQKSREIPVLFLSARDKDQDRLTGLGLGADDYMVKPFLPRELLLRMAAILKRSYSYESAAAETYRANDIAFADVLVSDSAQPHHLLSLGSHLIDFDAATVTCGGETDTLTVKELKILEKLEESRGRIVTFDNLCAAVWNARYYTYENTVMVHMRRLREKVEDDPSHPKWIVTARGIGYKLNLKPAEPKKKQ